LLKLITFSIAFISLSLAQPQRKLSDGLSANLDTAYFTTGGFTKYDGRDNMRGAPFSTSGVHAMPLGPNGEHGAPVAADVAMGMIKHESYVKIPAGAKISVNTQINRWNYPAGVELAHVFKDASGKPVMARIARSQGAGKWSYGTYEIDAASGKWALKTPADNESRMITIEAQGKKYAVHYSMHGSEACTTCHTSRTGRAGDALYQEPCDFDPMAHVPAAVSSESKAIVEARKTAGQKPIPTKSEHAGHGAAGHAGHGAAPAADPHAGHAGHGAPAQAAPAKPAAPVKPPAGPHQHHHHPPAGSGGGSS